ncbi:hypothetical protein ACP4OV_006206 [Aristida adscensionis]
MPIMKALKRMQQTLIKFGKRVSRVTAVGGKKKAKKIQLDKDEDGVPKKTEMAATAKPDDEQQTPSNVAERSPEKTTEVAVMEKPEQHPQTPSKVDERVTGKTDVPVAEKSKQIQMKTPNKIPGDVPVDGAPPAAAKDAAAPALMMDLGSCDVPHHGDDAHFVLPGAGVAGLADGVGGYRKIGKDAGAFARALMENASASARSARPAAGKPILPYALLQRAYEATKRARAPAASTAVILSLDGGTLRWAYVGDSGFVVFRGGKIIRRSRPQQHRPNYPYQLCATGGDSVKTAVVGDMPVNCGDVVVAGTDGLFDNMFDDELVRLVQKDTELGLTSQDMADDIAHSARRLSLRCRKIDDITVVVGFIVAANS